MSDKNGECPVCFEEFNSLKLLQCGHAFCMVCIEKNKLVSPCASSRTTCTVKCPMDRKCSILPDGKVERLKSKFFVDLPCANCYENESINKSWWCEVCQLTICSYCVVKKHSAHVDSCKEWQHFDVVKECYALYKSSVHDTQDINEWRNSVHEFCICLEEQLIKMVDGDDSLKNVLVTLENTFGSIDEISLPDGHTVDKLEQKLSTISNIMQKVSRSSTLPKISNVVKRKRHPILPSAEQVFEFCYKSNISGDSSSAEATTPLATVNTCPQHPITGIKYLCDVDFVSDGSKNTEFVLHAPPCIICSVSEDCVAILDEFGIRILNVVCNEFTKVDEWSRRFMQFSLNSHAVFRYADNMLLFTATDQANDDCLVFYSIENLTIKAYDRFPPGYMYGYFSKHCRRLVAVICSTEYSLVACSDGSKSELWIFDDQNPTTWSIKWVGNLQEFIDLQVVGGDTIIISGHTEIYQYSAKLNSVFEITYLGKVNAASGFLFQLYDDCYVIDIDCNKLVHVYSKQNVLKDYEITGNEAFLSALLQVNDQLVCSLSLPSFKSPYTLGKFLLY